MINRNLNNVASLITTLEDNLNSRDAYINELEGKLKGMLNMMGMGGVMKDGPGMPSNGLTSPQENLKQEG